MIVEKRSFNRYWYQPNIHDLYDSLKYIGRYINNKYTDTDTQETYLNQDAVGKMWCAEHSPYNSSVHREKRRGDRSTYNNYHNGHKKYDVTY